MDLKLQIGRLAILCAVLIGPNVASATGVPKHAAPIPAGTVALMAARDTTAASPIVIRTYKKEAELEIWKRARSGRFVLLKTFPICRWSGQLGPKVTLGDRQTPEGFYAIGPKQMNPNSAYHLSFDIGFPNAYDRAHGASGSYLMVHGACSSAGCYAMTDDAIREIYAIAREAFAGGQRAFQFQAYPFRMTAQNMARHRSDPNIAFWRQLKEGSDRFEATGEEPAVSVSGARYIFGPSKDPAREELAKARLSDVATRIATVIADGSAAVRTTYADGGQHPSFKPLLQRGALGEVSRPEALALAGREVIITPARTKRPAIQTAELKSGAAQAAGSSQPIVLAALSADYIPLFEPTPLTLTAKLAPAPSTVTGSVRILAAALGPTQIEVAAETSRAAP
jgi:murein L,D-transpeptidase YafK